MTRPMLHRLLPCLLLCFATLVTVPQLAVAQGDDDLLWVYTSDDTYRLTWLNPLPLPNQQTEAEGSLHAPMPGQVIAVNVEVGQAVAQGEVLLIIEAMKMEHRITAPYAGTVSAIRYNTGDTVQQDAVMLALDAEEQSGE